MIEKLSHETRSVVIALGGGALMSQKTLHRVTSTGMLVYVKSSPENIFKRIKHSRRRPLLSQDGAVPDQESYMLKIVDLLKQRESGYLAAHLVFDRDRFEAEKCAEQLAVQIVEIGQIEK